MKKAFLATVALPLAMALGGCENMLKPPQTPEQKKTETIERLNREFGLQIRDITVPEGLNDLPKGQYQVKIKTSDGEKDCVANVITTTHGHKNVILNCP